jgi:hypothetical protein
VARLFSIEVVPRANVEDHVRLVKELPERMEHLMPMLPYLSATYVLKHIKQKLPQGGHYRAYREGLEVAKVSGMSQGEYAYTVHINPKHRLVRSVPGEYVLLYVHQRKRMGRPDPAVSILEKFNPWTIESLPFTPNPKFGYVRTKRARPILVANTTAKKMRQRPRWAKELARVGHKQIRKGKQIQLSRKSQMLSNVAIEALKMEFGLGGAKPNPMWRIAVSKVVREGLRVFSRDKKFSVFPFTKYSYRLWQKWPTRTKSTIQLEQARRYINFQKKLGISL